ncbi:serine hydrolase domain-containing protein [Lysobacter sp. A3-1-A15]|uniref:serine hydrolase domain-containing protein n=1 Tax=Novilysobacter viscosus TaxID=3098602 RepID=UPI002EDB7D24
MDTRPHGLAEFPKSPHWNAPAITRLAREAPQHRSDALIIAKEGQLVLRQGQAVEKINTHSVRKSIIAVLYGMAIEKGLLELDDSLEELGFDDRGAPLTQVEKQATIRDLMTSRSGIYIDASGQNWERPDRHASKPGEKFFYNNWGFNALGEILERETGMALGEVIATWLAEPLGMQHFTPADVHWDGIDGSSVRQYVIYMSADDLMRLAVLVAEEGNHRGERLVSAQWIRDMTAMHSSTATDPKRAFGGGFFDGYGYMWWTRLHGGRRLLCADGWGGQIVIIDPETRVVMVSRRNTGTNLLAQGWFIWRGVETDRPYVYALFERVNALLQAG